MRLQVGAMAAAPPGEQNGALKTQQFSRKTMVPVDEMKRANSNNAAVSKTSSTVKLESNGLARNGAATTSLSLSKALKPESGALDAANRARIAQQLLEPATDTVTVLPSDETFSWSKENYNSIQRSIDVWNFLLTFRLKVFLVEAKWTYVGGFTEEKKSARRRSTACWLRESILQLGPTFIKLGQLSSTRSDLFPAEYVQELAKLQDRVPAFSAEKAEKMIEKELGVSVYEIFSEFEKQPLAAASLGQVHRAVLRNGEKVAVKLQRPGLKELFDIDLQNLKFVAEFYQKNESLGGAKTDWVGVYEECSTILYKEIDYINEGRNADKFRRDFRNVKWVRVPQVFWDYTSRKVLTLEYLPGIKINDPKSLDAASLDRSLVASRAIEAYLIQILKTGFFHADPHPGNLAVDKSGALIYYDFGMMGDIKSFTREKLLELFYAVYEEDAKKVIQALVDLGALVPTGDMGSVRKTVKFFLKNLTNQRPDQATTLTAIGEDLFAIALDQPFRFPATFTFVLRAFSSLEGIGYILDPNFSFTKVAAPYAQELLDVKDSRKNVVEELQRQAQVARDAAVSMPGRVQKMEDFLQQLETGDIKLRVRVLEAERASRKASILQTTTMNLVVAATLVNLGVTSVTQGLSEFATASFVGAGFMSIFVFLGMRRVRRLDNFEDMIK